MGGRAQEQVVGDPPPCTRAELGLSAIVLPAPGGWRAHGLLRDDWIHVEHQLVREPVQPVQRAGLSKKRRCAAQRGGPAVLRSSVLDVAHDVEIPLLLIRGLVLEALEGNADFHLIPVVREPPLGCKEEVLAQVRRRTCGQGATPAGRL